MTTALRAARVFDGERLLEEPVVVVDGSTVTSAGVAPPDGAPVVDLGDVTILPGLVDAHQHLVFDGRGTIEEQVAGRSDDELRERARASAQRALRAGITTIRDLGDRGFVTLDLRSDPDGPTVLTSGPPLTAEGGHCWFLGGCCGGREELVQAVHERKRRGCDWVKIMVTGGALTPTFPLWMSQFTADDVAAVVETAHSVGLPVAAHCHGIEGTIQALDAGVDTIEHCSFIGPEGSSRLDDDLLERIARSGTPVSATMGHVGSSQPPPAIAANLAVVQDGWTRLHAMGATLVAGTDAGVGLAKPHDVLPHAAQDLAELGLAPQAILTSLTATAAQVCGVGHRKGRLAAGYDADLLAVAGNPLGDISALTRPHTVWHAGREVSRA